jgi:hypothetical protein
LRRFSSVRIRARTGKAVIALRVGRGRRPEEERPRGKEERGRGKEERREG